MSRGSRILSAILLLAWMACAPKDEWFGVTEPPRDDTLIVNNGTEPETLDPALMNGNIEGNLAFSLFEGLTRFDPKTLDPLPGVATNWHVSADGRTWTFHLRSDAVWSDGSPITSLDFAWSWLRLLAPTTAARYASFLYLVENAEAFSMGTMTNATRVGIRCPDSQTLVVTLVRPAPYFPFMTAFYVTMPVHRKSVERHGQDWTNPENLVSNGPFVLKTWQMHRKIELIKNERYHGRNEVHLKRVIFLPIEDTGTVLNLYRRGDIDMLNDVPLELFSWLKTRRDYSGHPGWGVYYYKFNINRKPFDDRRVRLALSLAINRSRLTDEFLAQGQIPATAFTPPIPDRYFPPGKAIYDPQAARKLLADAGYPEGRGFPAVRLLYNTIATDLHRHVAEVLQAMWKQELGITIQLEVQEWKTYLKSVENREFDLARAGWVGDFPDPGTFLDLFLQADGNNNTGWTDPEYTRHVEAALFDKNPATRMQSFHKAELILLDEMPVIPVFYYAFTMLKKPWVDGVFGNFQDIHPLRSVRIRKAGS
ncbi:MAG TPA: peptide ABC transporter substrate-binding protein [Spirochaetota bacterium]|nr:peptide ABC transporter substrate-binding protein [Spirochaetota bacterium]